MLGCGLQDLLESSAPSPQQPEALFDGPRRLRQLLGVAPGELLTTDMVARDYAFPSAEAARKYIRRYVPHLTRGRKLLVDRRDFEASMVKHRKTRLARTA